MFMIIKSVNIGKIGITPAEVPYFEIGSGSPTGTILAVQHGGEWSPLWVIKSFLEQQKSFTGTARIIPVVNQFGFIAGVRNEIIEGKDLNRQYPGNPKGDFSARLADVIFTLCQSVDFVIDLHTFERQTPFVAGYTKGGAAQPKIEKLMQLLAPDIVWVINEKKGEDRRFQGSLDGALTEIGIPCVFLEMPNYSSIQSEFINRISQGLVNVFNNFNSTITTPVKKISEFSARYLYADMAGLFEPLVVPLQQVNLGDPIPEI